MRAGFGPFIVRATAAAGREQISEKGFLMSAVWIVVGLGALGAAIALIASWQRGGPGADLGTVSSQWISEHRLGQESRR